MSAKNQHISEHVPKESLGESPMPQLILSPREPKGPKTLTVPVDPKLLEAGDHNGSTFYQHERFTPGSCAENSPWRSPYRMASRQY